jgi:hypothetical protein
MLDNNADNAMIAAMTRVTDASGSPCASAASKWVIS